MNTLSCVPVRRAVAGAFLILASFGLALSGRAATADAAVHDELRKLQTAYETAVNTNDLAALTPVFEPGSSGITVDGQAFKSPEDLKAIYERFHASFPGVIYRIKLNPEPSVIFGDVAVAYGTGEEYVKTAAGEFTYPTSFTAVLHRNAQQQWKLVRSQFTMDPFRNSVVDYFISRAKLYFGGGALVAGLLVGFIVGRVSASKKPAAA